MVSELKSNSHIDPEPDRHFFVVVCGVLSAICGVMTVVYATILPPDPRGDSTILMGFYAAIGIAIAMLGAGIFVCGA